MDSSRANVIKVGILTVSDSSFRGTDHPEKGTRLRDTITSIQSAKCSVDILDFVPDEIEQIKAKLVEWSDFLQLDVILTTGGTGFAARDVTPEATKLVLEKEAPGMTLAMLKGSLDITPLAMLSRLVCGTRNKSLIINLPGNPNGAAECFQLVWPGIPHAVDLLRGHNGSVEKTHETLQAEGIQHSGFTRSTCKQQHSCIGQNLHSDL
ncbi:gephyrin [Plakobranchus ocellatus]|uniref:molybdopterin molybdotransferase n=1 Tax=Plakobranchus ocellatus TaxID=259542 RepID=A0AAV4DYW6_9GAST|nr:gephyrin [Plakobranchus ocellatus]